jgi:hypothetical protein
MSNYIGHVTAADPLVLSVSYRVMMWWATKR